MLFDGRVLRGAFAAGLALVGVSVASETRATTYEIDFESFAEGTFINGIVDLGDNVTATVSSTRTSPFNESGLARICDTRPGSECARNDPDLAQDQTEVNTGETAQLGNVLIMQGTQSEVNDSPNGAFFEFTDFLFDGQPMTFTLDSIDFLDTADDGGNGGALLFLNDDAQPFETTGGKSAFGGGNKMFETVVVGLETDRIRVSFSGSGALDNIQLSVSPIPLPMSGWMLLAGLGATAVAARRRRTG